MYKEKKIYITEVEPDKNGYIIHSNQGFSLMVPFYGFIPKVGDEMKMKRRSNLYPIKKLIINGKVVY